MEKRHEAARLPDAVARTGIPVDAFNPLLRSLLSWDLVHREELADGTHRWELTEAAQRQLDALTPARRRAAPSLAYLDHWCARCRQHRLTHLREGRFLCEECERLEAIGGQATARGASSERSQQRETRPSPRRQRRP